MERIREYTATSKIREFNIKKENNKSNINNIAINSFAVNLDVNKNNLNIEDNKLNEKNIEEMDVESEIINYKFSKIEEEKYIVQGITSIDDKLLISAYTKEEDDNNKRLNSKVYIYNKENNEFEGEIILNNNAHVGGIAIDEKNKVLYVTGSNGKVNTYSYDAIIKNLKDADKIDLNNPNLNDCVLNSNISIKELTKKGTASTICLKDGYLYIATFSGTENGELVKLKLDYSNSKQITTKQVGETISIPELTQGIEIVNYNNKEYLLTTESIGKASSVIRLFELKDGKLNELGIKILEEKGIEGIHVDENYDVMYSFENEYEKKDYSASKVSFNDLKNEIENNNESLNLPQTLLRTLAGIAYEAK